MHAPFKSHAAEKDQAVNSRSTLCRGTANDSSTEGVSAMRLQNKFSRFTFVVLLFIAMSIASATAQFPAPTVPPTPATVPASQTIPAGFEMTGFIQFASVDQLCV